MAIKILYAAAASDCHWQLIGSKHSYIIYRPLVISTDVAELNHSVELHCKCTGSQMSKARYTRDTIAGSVYTPCSMYPRPGMRTVPYSSIPWYHWRYRGIELHVRPTEQNRSHGRELTYSAYTHRTMRPICRSDLPYNKSGHVSHPALVSRMQQAELQSYVNHISSVKLGP